jgi:hypothetical protein
LGHPFAGLDHRSGQARAFFPARQELAVAQTACRSYKNPLAWPALYMVLAETMIKAVLKGDVGGHCLAAEAATGSAQA